MKAPPAFHEYTGADSARNIFAASAKGPLGALTLAAAHQFVFEDSAYDAPIVTRHSDGLLFVKSLAAGSTFHFGLVGTTITSAHVADPYNEAQRLAAYGATLGLSQLRSAHASAWAKLWKGDIRIDGDNAIQRDVHAMLYHLYSFIRAGTSYSISPMGLSRSTGGYLGHIFWDAEFWMFPTLLALQPDLARSMLDYRFARLDAARRNATFHGYRGAMFPWESAASGEEDTPSPAVSGMLEIHITADIGIAAWNYYRATQDRDWLRENGYPIIRDTAEFWTSRVERNGPANFSILGVVAADEYAANVDNNAFTNAAARENLAAATAAAKVLGLAPDPDWETVRRNIPILVFPDGTTREHATYTGEKVKQADVNLLAFPLQTITDAAAIRRDLEYYYQRIDHDRGPAMTKSVFAVLWQRLGEPERALAMFKSGYQLNERPPFGVLAEAAYTSNPYFCTGAGGLLQTMIYGFGGLELTDHGFEHHPELLPAAWRSVILTGIGPQREDFEVRNSRATSSPAARNN